MFKNSNEKTPFFIRIDVPVCKIDAVKHWAKCAAKRKRDNALLQIRSSPNKIGEPDSTFAFHSRLLFCWGNEFICYFVYQIFVEMALKGDCILLNKLGADKMEICR